MSLGHPICHQNNSWTWRKRAHNIVIMQYIKKWWNKWKLVWPAIRSWWTFGAGAATISDILKFKDKLQSHVAEGQLMLKWTEWGKTMKNPQLEQLDMFSITNSKTSQGMTISRHRTCLTSKSIKSNYIITSNKIYAYTFNVNEQTTHVCLIIFYVVHCTYIWWFGMLLDSLNRHRFTAVQVNDFNSILDEKVDRIKLSINAKNV